MTASVTLMLPLLAGGPCVSIMEESLIRGLFNVVTPVLVEHAKDALGLPDTPPAGSSGGSS